jgi:hypothetical protein
VKLIPSLLAASLAGNVLIAAVWGLKPAANTATGRKDSPHGLAGGTEDSAAARARTDAAADRAVHPPLGEETAGDRGSAGKGQWEAAEDEDLPAYAARLRNAGLPESAVRHLVSAAIDRRFRDREQALGSGARPRPRYWEVGQNQESLETRLARLDLRRQKAQLLSSALGGETGTPDELFDSPIAPEHRDLVRMITQDYDAMITDIRGRAGGILLESEKEEIAYLEAERRQDLAGILTPQELGDYEMINSNTFRSLRHELSGFQTTEEEFRSIYETQRALDAQFRPDSAVRRVSSPEERRAETAARAAADEQLRTLLGPERFASYARARDREYQQLSALVQRVALPESTAIEIFGVREFVSTESNRIAADHTLTNDQQLAALAQLAQGARARIRAQLPGEAGDAYLQVADGWLNRVQEGGAITFQPNGTYVRSIRRQPSPPPPPKPGG